MYIMQNLKFYLIQKKLKQVQNVLFCQYQMSKDIIKVNFLLFLYQKNTFFIFFKKKGWLTYLLVMIKNINIFSTQFHLWSLLLPQFFTFYVIFVRCPIIVQDYIDNLHAYHNVSKYIERENCILPNRNLNCASCISLYNNLTYALFH